MRLLSVAALPTDFLHLILLDAAELATHRRRPMMNSTCLNAIHILCLVMDNRLHVSLVANTSFSASQPVRTPYKPGTPRITRRPLPQA